MFVGWLCYGYKCVSEPYWECRKKKHRSRAFLKCLIFEFYYWCFVILLVGIPFLLVPGKFQSIVVFHSLLCQTFCIFFISQPTFVIPLLIFLRAWWLAPILSIKFSVTVVCVGINLSFHIHFGIIDLRLKILIACFLSLPSNFFW